MYTKFINFQIIILRAKLILKAIAPVILIAIFYLSGGAVVPLLFILIPIWHYFGPSKEKRFRDYQQTLPTSKIGSVAMGLAEISGKIRPIKILNTPLGGKQAVGYRYEKERISYDEDGDAHYTTIYSTCKYEPFFIEDETGKIRVETNNLEMLWFQTDVKTNRGDERHSQFVLHTNEEVMLIGQVARSEQGDLVITNDPQKNLFVISPKKAVTFYNKYRPLLNQFINYASLFGFIASIILIIPMDLEGSKLVFDLPTFDSIKSFNFFENIFPFLSILTNKS